MPPKAPGSVGRHWVVTPGTVTSTPEQAGGGGGGVVVVGGGVVVVGGGVVVVGGGVVVVVVGGGRRVSERDGAPLPAAASDPGDEGPQSQPIAWSAMGTTAAERVVASGTSGLVLGCFVTVAGASTSGL